MRKYKLSLEDVKKRKWLSSSGQSVVAASSRMESSQSRTQHFETDQHPERAKNFGRHLELVMCWCFFKSWVRKINILSCVVYSTL